MTGPERKGELAKALVTAQSIATKCQVSRSYVAHVIYGRRRHARIERLIARAIRRPVEEVFEPAPPIRRRRRALAAALQGGN